jgi:cobalamin biosynthesis Mg chelatase CobN
MAGPAGTTGTTQANPDNLNNGTTFNNGFVGTGAVGSGVLSTPGGTFASPAPTAGISDAGRAGITANAPMNTGVQSTLENSTVVYTNGAPVNPSNVNVSAAANTGGRLINDMGPSFYSDTVGGGANTVSLGQVAAQYKAAKGAVNARTLTNDDVQKMLGEKTGVTMAKNMPPLGPGAVSSQSSGTQSSSQTAQASSTQDGTQAQSGAQTASQSSASQTAQSGTSAGQQSQTAATGQQAGTPPPATNQGQATGSETAAGNSTTPQINQNQQSNDAQGKSKLPATSTFLPLFGLLGVVSGGLGLWFRKFRK